MNTHSTDTHSPATRSGAREHGYALIALLALMTVLMITMMAAAPSIRQQSRRNLELEAIARGEEVAEAIRMYIHLKNAPPTSMEELLEGVAPPGRTKKVMVLRASAARDPLSESGEWRTIKANDREFVGFIRSLAEYGEGKLPNAAGTDSHPSMTAIANTLPRINSIVTGLDTETISGASGGEDDSLSSKGPFVGVSSRSRRESIITYYGIDRHDGWVFTPFYR
jgi:type II secretory pathway pseudopilin PulG